MRTVFTVIINKYDDLKPVFWVSQHWKYVCFSDREIDVPEGSPWQVKIIPKIEGLSDAKMARRIKIRFWEYIDTEDSLFIDGTFYINTDLNRWWKRFNEPMTVVNHPFDDCLYTDIKSCLAAGKGDFKTLIRQAHDYMALGVPENNGLISSGILMRRNTKEVREFCKLWWDEVEKYTERDQIAFGYARWKMPGIFNTTIWNYTAQEEFIHCPHLHKSNRDQRQREILRKHKR